MAIRSTQSVLDQLYAVRDDLLTGKVASYSMGDRTITLQNMQDLERIIQNYESAVLAQGGVIKADLSEGTVTAYQESI